MVFLWNTAIHPGIKAMVSFIDDNEVNVENQVSNPVSKALNSRSQWQLWNNLSSNSSSYLVGI